MSKMDGLRAMREARHAEMVARSKTAKPSAPEDKSPSASAAKKSPKPSATTSKAPSATAVDAASAPETLAEALCGHRNMSGRTCTREQGHAAKSHRYS